MRAVQIRLKVEKMKKRGEKVREYFVAGIKGEGGDDDSYSRSIVPFRHAQVHREVQVQHEAQVHREVQVQHEAQVHREVQVQHEAQVHREVQVQHEVRHHLRRSKEAPGRSQRHPVQAQTNMNVSNVGRRLRAAANAILPASEAVQTAHNMALTTTPYGDEVGAATIKTLQELEREIIRAYVAVERAATRAERVAEEEAERIAEEERTKRASKRTIDMDIKYEEEEK
jgi:hypothetical protein